MRLGIDPPRYSPPSYRSAPVPDLDVGPFIPATAVVSHMTVAGLSRESIRDISGNLVPIGILLFFMLWFVVDAPWGRSMLSTVLVYGLFGSLVVTLFAVTYVVARKFDAADVE